MASIDRKVRKLDAKEKKETNVCLILGPEKERKEKIASSSGPGSGKETVDSGQPANPRDLYPRHNGFLLFL